MQKEDKYNKNSFSGVVLNRLNRFGYGLSAFVLLFTISDKSLGEIIWNGNETKLIKENELMPGVETWVVVPGLGVQSGSGIASTLNSNLGHRQNLTYFNYSDDGTDIEIMASDIVELYNETQAPINIYAHSMGASISLEVLKNLNNTVPVKSIIFDCSPYDVNDAQNPAAPLYSEFSIAYPGGFFTKIGAEVLNNTVWHENNNLSLYGQLKDSFRIAITGSSPRLFTNQLGLLGDTKSDDYKYYISEDTRLMYLKPQVSTEDDTVMVDNAIAKYKTIIGDKLIVVNIPNAKHASPTQRPNEYNNALWPYIVGLQEEPHLK